MVARPGFADRSTMDAAMTGPDAAAPGAEPHAGGEATLEFQTRAVVGAIEDLARFAG
jgi:hypothetical protein